MATASQGVHVFTSCRMTQRRDMARASVAPSIRRIVRAAESFSTCRGINAFDCELDVRPPTRKNGNGFDLNIHVCNFSQPSQCQLNTTQLTTNTQYPSPQYKVQYKSHLQIALEAPLRCLLERLKSFSITDKGKDFRTLSEELRRGFSNGYFL